MHSNGMRDEIIIEEKRDISKAKWFKGLQSLRAILFVLVFLSHSGGYFSTFGTWGGGAVCVFFVLSGFLSCYYYKVSSEGGIFQQCAFELWHKVKKFYPLYLCFLLVAAYVNKGTWTNFLKCLLLVQSFFGDSKSALCFNWPTWFLSSIMLSYFLSPIINKCLSKIRNKSVVYECVALTVIIAVVSYWGFVWKDNCKAYSLGYYWLYIAPPARLLDFALGGVLANLYLRYEQVRFSEEKELFLEFLTIIILIVSLCQVRTLPPHLSAVIARLPAAIFLVIEFARERSVFTRFCANNGTLLYLGERSFELYIVHRMMLLYFSRIGKNGLTWILALISTVVISEFAFRLKTMKKIRY